MSNFRERILDEYEIVKIAGQAWMLCLPRVLAKCEIFVRQDGLKSVESLRRVREKVSSADDCRCSKASS